MITFFSLPDRAWEKLTNVNVNTKKFLQKKMNLRSRREYDTWNCFLSLNSNFLLLLAHQRRGGCITDRPKLSSIDKTRLATLDRSRSWPNVTDSSSDSDSGQNCQVRSTPAQESNPGSLDRLATSWKRRQNKRSSSLHGPGAGPIFRPGGLLLFPN